MADSEYPYPPDEFDREAATASLHGAHRAELPFWRQNLVYLIIIAAAFILLLVLLFAIGGMGRSSEEARTEAPTTTAEQTEQTTAEGEATSEAPPAAEPNRETPVLVLNAGGINGMAGAWRDALQGSGWTSVDISTADTVQEEPVVFYRDEADAATAQALADEVGAGEARQSDEYDAAITFLAVAEPGGDQGGDGQQGDEEQQDGEGE